MAIYQPVAKTVTITSGAQLSTGVRVTNNLVALVTPAALTSTTVTFLGSVDGDTYTAIYGPTGAIYTATVAADRHVPLNPAFFQAANYIKVLAGSTELGDRTITLVMRTDPVAGEASTSSGTGGTQYTEGDTDATIVGNAVAWEDTSDTLRIASNTYPLPVQQAALSASVDAVAATGNVAHDAVDSGNPIKVGGKAASATPASVAAGDRVDGLFTLSGKQVTLPYALSDMFVSGTTAVITDTTTTQVIAAPAAGLKLYITHIIVQNSDATVGTLVTLEEETSGTDLYKVYCPPAGGGASITLPVPLVVPTAAKGLFAVCGTTSAEVYVSASGYKAP